jgi:hypothetical protein
MAFPSNEMYKGVKEKGCQVASKAVDLATGRLPASILLDPRCGKVLNVRFSTNRIGLAQWMSVFILDYKKARQAADTLQELVKNAADTAAEKAREKGNRIVPRL